MPTRAVESRRAPFPIAKSSGVQFDSTRMGAGPVAITARSCASGYVPWTERDTKLTAARPSEAFRILLVKLLLIASELVALHILSFVKLSRARASPGLGLWVVPSSQLKASLVVYPSRYFDSGGLFEQSVLYDFRSET
ncbi:hypothetical protein C8J57DRAFT_1219111 [Mycena rebaudengoi]|nr:hypothetical protein C8J57DRAFT_1219111 [Mycena rebaudengoi]